MHQNDRHPVNTIGCQVSLECCGRVIKSKYSFSTLLSLAALQHRIEFIKFNEFLHNFEMKKFLNHTDHKLSNEGLDLPILYLFWQQNPQVKHNFSSLNCFPWHQWQPENKKRFCHPLKTSSLGNKRRIKTTLILPGHFSKKKIHSLLLPHN